MMCGECYHEFEVDPPQTGDGVECPFCLAAGYGTFDQDGNYMIEWYE